MLYWHRRNELENRKWKSRTNIQPDGSAFTLPAYVRGVLFVISYVGNRSIKLGALQERPAAPAGIRKAFRFGPKSGSTNCRPNFAAHQELYGVPA